MYCFLFFLCHPEGDRGQQSAGVVGIRVVKSEFLQSHFALEQPSSGQSPSSEGRERSRGGKKVNLSLKAAKLGNISLKVCRLQSYFFPQFIFINPFGLCF